jgi:hypothetical protein
MPAHNAKITETSLLALLRSHYGQGFAIEALADHFACSFSAVSMLTHRLAEFGVIRCSKQPGRGCPRLYHVGPLNEGKPAPVAHYVGAIVPPFKPDNWKRPMQDYDARFAATVSLAMLSRRA